MEKPHRITNKRFSDAVFALVEITYVGSSENAYLA